MAQVSVLYLSLVCFSFYTYILNVNFERSKATLSWHYVALLMLPLISPTLALAPQDLHDL
jgi:hypothetical protein